MIINLTSKCSYFIKRIRINNKESNLKKYRKIIIILVILLIIVCYMLIKLQRNTNIFINYFVLNYLEQIDETFNDLSTQLYEVRDKEDLFNTVEKNYKSIKSYCFLSSKLEIIDNTYNSLNLKDFSTYLLDICGLFDSMSEYDIEYHTNNLQNICKTYNSLSEGTDLYNIKDYYNNINAYQIEKKYIVSNNIGSTFDQIRKLSKNGIDTLNK